RGLPDRDVAADRGHERIPGPDRYGEIERRDDPDDTQRMPLLVHAVAGALGMHGQAVELAREADGELADVDHLLHLAVALGLGLAHFQRDQRTERILVLAQRLGAQPDRLAAARRRGGAPDLEGGLGAFDDPLVVGFGGGGDAAERLAGGRIDRFERAGAGGGPFAVAEESAGFLGPKAERGED